MEEAGGPVTRAAGATGSSGSQAALQAENERLRKELARMTEQCDILKKAAGILSEPPRIGMPGSKR
jgi:transposase